MANAIKRVKTFKSSPTLMMTCDRTQNKEINEDKILNLESLEEEQKEMVLSR